VPSGWLIEWCRSSGGVDVVGHARTSTRRATPSGISVALLPTSAALCCMGMSRRRHCRHSWTASTRAGSSL
jgi:hypothetical protein